MNSIILQGYPGSFHDEASQKYFDQDLSIISADSFDELVRRYCDDKNIDLAIMAIENSIAGSILPNYRLIRDRILNSDGAHLRVVGEIYLPIQMQLMCLPGQQLSDIQEVHSHPMALRQCTRFLREHHHMKMLETIDTALSARDLRASNMTGVAAIASRRAAELYDLEIIRESIQDHRSNYTRFWILSRNTKQILEGANKASICCQISHSRGSLHEVLGIILAHDINMSKIQSLPIPGQLSQYYFHMDLEYEAEEQYEAAITELRGRLEMIIELGRYCKAEVSGRSRGM